MILTREEIAFLDTYCHEGTEPPFGGPATDVMTRIGVQSGDTLNLQWAYWRDKPPTGPVIGHASQVAPPLPWANRQAVLRRDAEISGIREVMQRGRNGALPRQQEGIDDCRGAIHSGKARTSSMIVTIDGPAGAGKSTAARMLAARLSFDFLDTGATYRTVALAAKEANVAIDEGSRLNDLLDSLRITMRRERVFLQGQDVTAAIRTPEVTALARAVADSPLVRGHLTQMQRHLSMDRHLVTEGRDQGTIVFPEAECKFFLTAEPLARAERRFRELQTRGHDSTLEQILESQRERDARDAERAIAPMIPARDAIVIDSTALTIEGVVDVMERHVRSRMM